MTIQEKVVLLNEVISYLERMKSRGYKYVQRKFVFAVMEDKYNWQKKMGADLGKELMQAAAKALGGRYDSSGRQAKIVF